VRCSDGFYEYAIALHEDMEDWMSGGEARTHNSAASLGEGNSGFGGREGKRGFVEGRKYSALR
jgi:hypothetical protein